MTESTSCYFGQKAAAKVVSSPHYFKQQKQEQDEKEKEKREEEDADKLRILIASDCHIGYMEKEPERRNDSLNTFEEVLQVAREKKVDMILLGGDLFHHNKPSRYFRYHCMRLLKYYCRRDAPSPIQIIPHPDHPEKSASFPVHHNNIVHQTPVFSVHGNHDNPSGLGNLCALDVLSEAGLINHFGKAMSHDSVEMCPVLIRKGRTKVALYGLGSITDKALHQLFESGKVSMIKPPGDVQSWYSMFVIHQNRAYRGDKEYIPESFLDEKLNMNLDLVIWGHEHDCQLDPVWYKKKFRIIQPGSTIATSIVRGETKQKHVALLEVKGKYMRCTKIPLTSVRPMYIKMVALKFPEHRLDPSDVDIESKVEDFCAQQIRRMVEAVTRDNKNFPKRPLLPLIKLRVDVSGGYPTFNKRRFAQQFVHTVANVRVHGHDEQNLIDFKDKEGKKKPGTSSREPEPTTEKKDFIEDSIEDELNDAKGNLQLKVLSSTGLVKLLQEYVKNDNNAHQHLVDIVLNKATDHLKHTNDEKLLEDEFKKFRKARQHMQESEIDNEVQTAITLAKRTPEKSKRDDKGSGFMGALLRLNESSPSRRPRGRGKSRGRPRGRPKGTGKGARSLKWSAGVSKKGPPWKRKRMAVVSDSSSSSSSSESWDDEETSPEKADFTSMSLPPEPDEK